MDVLSDIFETIRLRGTLFFSADLAGTWGTKIPQREHAARFHYLLSGVCHVTLPSGGTVELGAGDLILLPAGHAHTLRHAPGAEAPPLDDLLQDAGCDGSGLFVLKIVMPGATTCMVCGHLIFEDGAEHPLLHALPEHLLLTPAVRAQAPWLNETLRLLVDRVFSDGAGAVAAITRFSEVLFIEAIRAGIDQAPGLARILGAFADPQVGRALQIIHARPAEAWTVERLAQAVAMSRSRFAQRFDEAVGVPPMRYLSDWRLQRARAMLARTNASVTAIARDMGYSSPAVFTRAFTQRFGRAPSALRAAVETQASAARGVG